MKTQELLSQFPENFFSEKFKEKENAILGIGAPAEQIQNKKAQYDKVFQYDSLLQNLKNKLQENPAMDIDRYTSDRIIYHMGQLASINSYLENLIYSEPGNVEKIFENFSHNINHFFQTVTFNINTSGVSSGKILIDEHIKEVIDILRSFDTYSVNTKELVEAEKIGKRLIQNLSKFENAIKTAENWVQAESRAISSSLINKAQIFNDKAINEHKPRNIWGWFWGGLASGLVAVIVIAIFLYKDTNITVGAAMLRISMLVVISYFSIFCIQQFAMHRKLYESYRFKAIALTTMEELLKSYTEDRERILNKAVNIIFSEPNLKEDKHIQQKILDEAFDVAKKKIAQ